MELAKYLFSRFVLCIGLILIANQLYLVMFWRDDVSKHSDILEKLWVLPSDTESIYFGESSNFHDLSNVKPKKSISFLLSELLPRLKLGTIDNPGLHSGTYLAVIKNIPKKMPVKLFIITMNSRSFGADWRYSVGENYLSKTDRMLELNLPIINRFFVSLKHYDYKTDAQRHEQLITAFKTDKFYVPNFKCSTIDKWDSTMAWGGFLNENTNLTKENLPLACSYIKNYAFSIDVKTNSRIRDFDEIMEYAKKRKIKVVFNLLSENMEEAKKLAGINLIHLMDKNRKMLIDRYEKKGAIVVDNFYSVPDSCFVDRGWPTEHYSHYGKTIIANNLKNKIKKISQNTKSR